MNSSRAAILGVVTAGLILRFHMLDTPGFTWDELIYVKAAKTLIESLDHSPNVEHPPLAKALIGISTSVLGEGEQAARLPSSILGSGLIVIVYLLSRSLFNARTAIMASMLVAFDVNMIAYSRVATLDMAVAFFSLSSLYVYYISTWRPRACYVAGALLGAALLTRFDGILVLAIAMVWTVTHDLFTFRSFVKFATTGIATFFATALLSGYLSPQTLATLHEVYGGPIFLPTFKALVDAILLKSPVPLLLVLPFAAIPLAKRDINSYLLLWTFLIPVITLGLIRYVGLRYYILPIAALMSMAARGIALLGENKDKLSNIAKVGVTAMLAMSLVAVQVHPNYLTFVNQLALVVDDPWLSDADMGWGAGIAEAALTIRSSAIPGAVATNYAPHVVEYYSDRKTYFIGDATSTYPRLKDEEDLKAMNVSFIVVYSQKGGAMYPSRILGNVPEGYSLEYRKSSGLSMVSLYKRDDAITLSPEYWVRQWFSWARTAWSYFSPGIGVDFETGINYAHVDWHRVTDWDIGRYIIAILSAEKLGIIKSEGEWGADYRIEKIIDFLLNRKLTNDRIPFLLYDSETGMPVTEEPTNPSDSGRLLAALRMVWEDKPQFREEIERIVYQRTDYEFIASSEAMWRSTSGFYAYVDAYGFKLWGFDKYRPVRDALSGLQKMLTGDTILVYNISIPKGFITLEPLLIGVIELGLDELLIPLKQLYLAQERRYITTGKLTAWTEGAYDNVGTQNVYYIYEWIVLRDKAWVITTPEIKPIDISPIVYTKAAMAMHAIFNTKYTRTLIKYLSDTETERGFIEGKTEDGRLLTGIGGVTPVLTDKTNALIVNSAFYVISKLTENGT